MQKFKARRTSSIGEILALQSGLAVMFLDENVGNVNGKSGLTGEVKAREFNKKSRFGQS